MNIDDAEHYTDKRIPWHEFCVIEVKNREQHANWHFGLRMNRLVASFGTLFARAGHEVVFSYAVDERS